MTDENREARPGEGRASDGIGNQPSDANSTLLTAQGLDLASEYERFPDLCDPITEEEIDEYLRLTQEEQWEEEIAEYLRLTREERGEEEIDEYYRAAQEEYVDPQLAYKLSSEESTRQLTTTAPATRPPMFEPLDWGAIWDTTEEGEDWLVEPLIGRGRLVSLYSAPGVGKSLLALEIAAALASGGRAMGNDFEPTRVLYVDHENDPRGDVVSRLRDMGYSPTQLENLVYYSFPAMPTLDTEIGGRVLLKLALLHRVELVIIDTVSRTVKGEENSNDTWRELYLHTCRLLKAGGIACLRLDHSGKDVSKGQRGGSAKNGDVDMVWLLAQQSEKTFTLSCEKSRQHIPDEQKHVTVRREMEPLRHELAGQQPRVSDLVEHLARLKVPLSDGRDKAAAVLKQAGVKASNSDLSKALKQRKNLSGNVSDRSFSEG